MSRIADQIALIARNATQVVAVTTMPRSVTPRTRDLVATLSGTGFSVSISRYDWHANILGLPSWIGATLFGLALGSWRLGIFVVLATLILFERLYRLYFSSVEFHPSAKGHPRLRDIGTNLFFVVVQIIFWGLAFALLYASKYATKNF